MKLEQLHHFMEAVKYKSISIAAEENYISQPTFSASITKLEKELGVTLLRRTSRSVSPTEAGLIVLEKAETIFNTIEEMKQEVNVGQQKGTVKLSSIILFYNHILPRIVAKQKSSGQIFTLDVSTAESTQIVNNVTAGIDTLGIIIHSDNLINSDLAYVPLFSDQYILYVGSDSPFWDAESISLEEVMQQPYIAYRDEFQKDNAIWTTTLGKSFIPNIEFRTDNLELMKKMIAQNDYVAFFPEFMSQDDLFLQSGQIRAIPINDKKLEIEVGYIYNKKYKLSYIDNLFIASLEQTIRELAEEKPEHLLNM